MDKAEGAAVSDKNIEAASRALGLLFKLGVGAGALLMFAYCSSIGFYPTGVEVGDGLFFVAIALCFGFSYTLVVMFLGSAGAVLSTVLKPLFVLMEKKFAKDVGKVRRLQPFKLTAEYTPVWIVGTLALVFMVAYAIKDAEAALMLFGAAVVMAVGLAGLSPMADSGEQQRPALKFMLALYIYFAPLLVGGLFGNVLDQTFRLAGVRLESVSLYLDTEFYRDIVENGEIPNDDLTGRFQKLENAEVLFTGVGSSSLVKIKQNGGNGRVFVIPNDQFHIEIQPRGQQVAAGDF